MSMTYPPRIPCPPEQALIAIVGEGTPDEVVLTRAKTSLVWQLPGRYIVLDGGMVLVALKAKFYKPLPLPDGDGWRWPTPEEVEQEAGGFADYACMRKDDIGSWNLGFRSDPQPGWYPDYIYAVRDKPKKVVALPHTLQIEREVVQVMSTGGSVMAQFDEEGAKFRNLQNAVRFIWDAAVEWANGREG